MRWSEGERLDHLFEQRCDQFTGTGKDQAVVTDDVSLSFRELDNLANQVARYLLDQGIGSGDRVGLLFDRTIDTYVALLAVLKINAAYVPLDAGFPTERMRFILQDAGVKSIVSLSAFRDKLDEFAVRQILLDTAEREIAAKPKTRLTDAEKAPPVDQLAYLIYTSGTTGNPKGVVIEHPSICNFVRVAAEVYGFRPGDRVYQGMTIAFDFSVEELWVPLIAGATLVPGKPGASLVGDDLADFLLQRKVTGLCCVPTLLGDDREGPARPAHPAGLGRGLPAEPDGPLAPAGPHHPQRLWADRGHRHRDPDRAAPGQARHHRRAAADLLDRHPRPEQGRGALAGRDGRDRHRRHRARRRLPQPGRPDPEEVHPGLPRRSPTTRPDASTAPATSAASTRMTRSSSTAASTPRSRSAATGSS